MQENTRTWRVRVGVRVAVCIGVRANISFLLHIG